jgi:hypothetical protein
MPRSKISDSLVSQILQLSSAGKSDREIAQSLSLKRLQVAAIIAHSHLKDQQTAEALSEFAATGEARVPETAEPELATEAAPEEATEEAEAEDGIYVGDDSEYGDRFIGCRGTRSWRRTHT